MHTHSTSLDCGKVKVSFKYTADTNGADVSAVLGVEPRILPLEFVALN